MPNSAVGGRPSNFTPEQDAIILSVSSSEEVNKRFATLGEPPADAEAIIRRRAYLKSQGLQTAQPTRGEMTRAPAKLFDRVESIQAEIDRLRDRISILEEERAEAQAMLDEALRKRGYVPANGDV